MFNLGQIGGINSALGKTGSTYRLPETAAQAPTLPAGTDQALARVAAPQAAPAAIPQASAAPQAQPPQWTKDVQQGASLLDNLPSSNARNLPIVDLAKKVASGIVAFYTGGLSSLATNVVGQVMSKNNPKLGQAMGMMGGGGFGGLGG